VPQQARSSNAVLSTGAIQGIIAASAIAGFLLLVVAILLVVIITRRRRRQQSKGPVILSTTLLSPNIWNELTDIDIKEKLGEGHFGVVYRGLLIISSYTYPQVFGTEEM
jgi:hypothetical protein